MLLLLVRVEGGARLGSKARLWEALRMAWGPWLLLLVLLRPASLYSLHNCTLNMDDPHQVLCDTLQLPTIPCDVPETVEFLSLTGNSITSVTKSDFSRLRRLRTLALSWNKIRHIEDAAFARQDALTELDLRWNLLTNLTDAMFLGMPRLFLLDLSMNRITHLPQSAFAALKTLQVLRVFGNPLSAARDIVNVASACPWLNVLDLTGSSFTAFDSANFPFPLNITKIVFRYNPLSRFALHADVFPSLQILNLMSSSSELHWDVSEKTFLKSVRRLDLSETHFRKETYRWIFQSLSRVEELRVKNVAAVDELLLDWACAIPSLRSLQLGLNHMVALNDSLLRSCSRLTELDLSRNSLTDVSPFALRSLTRLSKLDVSFNSLSRVPLTVRDMSLTSLTLRSNHIHTLRCGDFSGLRLLTDLDLSANKLTELQSCAFADLQSLETLNIGQNFIQQFEGGLGGSLPQLRLLNAAGNKLEWIPQGVFRNMSHLTDLHLDSRTGTSVDDGALDELTSLQRLTYSPAFTDSRAPAGTDSASRGRSQLQRMFTLPSLQILHISFSECLYRKRDFLKGLDNLKVFTSQNTFCMIVDSKTFSYTPHLLHLKITKSVAWSPAAALFLPLAALQTLDLSENQLTSLDFLLQSNLTQLQTLILRSNELRLVEQKVFEALPALRFLDLSDNPFACNCSNADFRIWAEFNRRVFVSGAFRYTCASPPPHRGLRLLDFPFRQCWDVAAGLCFACSSTLVLLALLVPFVHHFLRLQLLYTFYLLRGLLHHRRWRGRGQAPAYDAFVSYNVHDEHWVYNELVPELEERQGWRLCLHHRDFQPGRAILENITDAIYSSRKTLCVISRHFLHSEWCSREVQMASFRLLDEKKDVLVLLFLEELSSNELSPFFRMRKLLRRRTYVSWSGARGHRGLFWERVRHALQSGAELSAQGPLPLDD